MLFVQKIIFSILLFCVSLHLFSREMECFEDADTAAPSDKIIESDFNMSLRAMFPAPEVSPLFFLDFSAGIGFRIVPGFCYIGAAADAGIGTDWFVIFSEDEEDDSDAELEQFGISLGARIYSSIKLADVALRPFFGCDFLFIVSPMLYAGMEVSYKIIGLEYAYYFSTPNDNPVRHQISLKLHLPQE